MDITGLHIVGLDEVFPGDVFLFDIPGTFAQIISAFDGPTGTNHVAL